VAAPRRRRASEGCQAHARRRSRETQSVDPDEALELAIKAAVDAGDVARAMALLEVLQSAPRPAPVVSLVRSKP
jgi:hypothetical protein